jgi:hypothetical protein
MISKNIVERWIMGYLTIIIQGIDLDMDLYCDSLGIVKLFQRHKTVLYADRRPLHANRSDYTDDFVQVTGM